MQFSPRSVIAALLLMSACAPGHFDASDTIPPPANIDPQPAPPAPPSGPDGSYRGTGTLSSKPSEVCIGQLDMDDMVVSHGQIRFGRFTGDVHPDGSVNLVSGRVHVQGRLVAGRFQGTLSDPKPGCDYHLDLARFS